MPLILYELIANVAHDCTAGTCYVIATLNLYVRLLAPSTFPQQRFCHFLLQVMTSFFRINFVTSEWSMVEFFAQPKNHTNKSIFSQTEQNTIILFFISFLTDKRFSCTQYSHKRKLFRSSVECKNRNKRDRKLNLRFQRISLQLPGTSDKIC